MTFRTFLGAAAMILAAGTVTASADSTFGRSVQGPNGRGVTVEGSASHDPETGRSRAATITTNGGNTYTRSTTADCSAGGGSANCSKTSTVSGSGKSASRSVNRSAGSGTAARTITREGPRGTGAVRQRWITINP
jgi:hypothetical protein